MLISKLSGFYRLQLGWNALSDGRSVFVKSLYAYCWVVSVLAILTHMKDFVILHYAGSEGGGIMLQLPGYMWKTSSVLGYKKYIVL